MAGFRLTRSFEKFCGYWPIIEPITSRLIKISPNEDLLSKDAEKRFKFDQLANGAVSSVSSVSVPVCHDCASTKYCRSVRISLKDFELSSSHRKKLSVFKEQMTVGIQRPFFDVDMFLLFKQYINARHGRTNTDMIRFGSEDYKNMVNHAEWLHISRSRDGGKLAAFSMIDHKDNDFCMEYTVYDPQQAKLSPGICTVLSVADSLKEVYKDGYLYLGSWSPGSPKTGYKQGFLGLEMFGKNGWEPVDRAWQPAQVPLPQVTHFLK